MNNLWEIYLLNWNNITPKPQNPIHMKNIFENIIFIYIIYMIIFFYYNTSPHSPHSRKIVVFLTVLDLKNLLSLYDCRRKNSGSENSPFSILTTGFVVNFVRIASEALPASAVGSRTDCTGQHSFPELMASSTNTVKITNRFGTGFYNFNNMIILINSI